MVKTCIVPGCRNESYSGCNISFYSFPKEEEMRQKWLKSLCITKNISTHSAVCSSHFEPSCFSKSPYTSIRYLNKDAVPTIYKVPKNDINTIMNNIVLVPAHQVTTHREASSCTSVETAPLLPLEEKPPEKKDVGTQTAMKFTTEREKMLQTRVKILQQRLSRRDKKFKQLQVLLISLLKKKRKKLDEL